MSRIMLFNKPLLLTSIFLFSVIFLIGLTSEVSMTEQATESQCAICHTDAKKLIRLSWEIEKIRPKAEKSAETSGEG